MVHTRLIQVVITSLFLAVYTYETDALLTSKYPGAVDFYIPWRAAQILLLERANPYTKEATQKIEIGMFGEPADPAKGQLAGDSAYPPFVSVVLAPLVFIPYD